MAVIQLVYESKMLLIQFLSHSALSLQLGWQL